MSDHVENIMRAARVLERLEAIGGRQTFEGVKLSEIRADLQIAAGAARAQEEFERVIGSPTNVVSLHGYSRKVPDAS